MISVFSSFYFFYVVYDLIISKKIANINYWSNFIILAVNFVYLFLLGCFSKVKVNQLLSFFKENYFTLKFKSFL